MVKKIVGSILVLSTLLVVIMFSNEKMESSVAKANSKIDEPIEFKINSTAIDTQNDHLVNDATFDIDYFSEKSTTYNNDLAIISLQMSLAASCTATSFDKYGETLKMSYVNDKNIDFNYCRNGYLTKAYKDMGFSNDIYYRYDVSLNDTSDRVAYGIASKEIKVNGEKYTLVNVTVRGSTYGGEWVSNYSLKNEEECSGSYSAGVEVYNRIKEYIDKYSLGKNTKIWLCGLSRGAAAANVAASYVDKACKDNTFEFERDNVYVYLTATPNYVMDPQEKEVKDELYDNIFNIIYENDITTMVALEKWGFKKFGKIYTIPDIYISSKNMKRIESGKKVSEKELSKEELALAKRVSGEYNKIRYGIYGEDNLVKKDTLYRGFSVSKRMTKVIEQVFDVFGNSVEDYEQKWQGIVTEILPFVLARAKKYDAENKEWVNYDNIQEYLVDKYGEEVLNKAIENGLYSKEEHNQKIEKVKDLFEKGCINADKRDKLIKLIDFYYGVKIIAINHNIDREFVSTTLLRVFNQLGGLIKNTYPLSDSKYYMKNHSGEFYLAWLRNYNPCTRKVL